MTSRTATIASSIGLHARPATLFAKKVAASGLDITLAKQGGSAIRATSVLAVMALGVRCGQEVVLTAHGEDADDVLDDLVTFLETDHDLTYAT